MLRFLQLPRDGNSGPQTFQLSDEQLNRLIAREGHGDPNETVRVLARENRKARDARRKAEEELAQLKQSGKVAPDGGAVLSADDAKAWTALKALLSGEHKLTAEQIVERVTKFPELQGELEKVTKAKVIDSVAEEMGWNPESLNDVLEVKKLEVVVRDVTVRDEGGKSVKKPVAHVRPVGSAETAWEPLADFADANFGKAIMSTLTSTDSDDDEGTTTEAQGETRKRSTSSTEATRVPNQARSRQAPAKTKSDDEIRDEQLKDSTFSVL
jgi:hypothetical protein